jgi:hypothetical protein
MNGVRTRWAGVALGGVGLALASATTAWPTTVLAVRAPEVGDFTKGYERQLWSWGRQAVYSTTGLRLDALQGPDPRARLVLLVVVLLLAAAGLLAWLLRPGRAGPLMGATGTAFALSALADSVVQRLSLDLRALGPQPGLVVVTTATGRLEEVAVLLLALSLAAALVPAQCPAAWARATGRLGPPVDRLFGRLGAGRAVPSGGPPGGQPGGLSGGLSVRRARAESLPGASPRLDPGGRDVGFSDVGAVEGPDDAPAVGGRD